MKRLVFCTGKVYYDLLDYRKENKRDDVAIIRLEQLYPLNVEEIKKLIKSYKNHESLVWVQEEPENMGAWSYILRNLRELPWEVVAPHESAAPATGSFKAWYKNQQNVINETFNLNNKK